MSSYEACSYFICRWFLHNHACNMLIETWKNWVVEPRIKGHRNSSIAICRQLILSTPELSHDQVVRLYKVPFTLSNCTLAQLSDKCLHFYSWSTSFSLFEKCYQLCSAFSRNWEYCAGDHKESLCERKYSFIHSLKWTEFGPDPLEYWVFTSSQISEV